MGRWVVIAFSLLDWALVVVLVIVILIGFRRGFWISMGTVAGAVVGVLGGLFLMRLIVRLVPLGVMRIIAMVAVTAVLIWLCMMIWRKIGRRLCLLVSQPAMRAIVKFLGAVVTPALAGLVISLVAFSISSVGVPGI